MRRWPIRNKTWFTIRSVGVIIILILAVLLRGYWLPLLGEFLVASDSLESVDAIVVLGGGERSRMAEGAVLLQEGYAPWLIVTDNPLNMPGIRQAYSELMITEAVWQGVPEDRILVTPGVAATTYEEALAVRELAQEQCFQSLILVTDPFHTRRAKWIFTDVLHEVDVSVIVYPAAGSWYQAESWWQTPDGLRETSMEYLKILAYILGYR